MQTSLHRGPVQRRRRAAGWRVQAFRAACAACAAAPALLAGNAAAQSSLNIYGIIDQGIARTDGGTTPTALLPGGTAARVWTVKAGNTSRLGFRATEDLGDGAYARFQIEHRFAADTGTPSNANVFWLGRSVVAAGSKRWGEIYGGREYSAAYWVPLFADPTLWSYVGQLGSPYSYANYTPVASSIEATNIRWANAVGYKSPNVGGFTGELQFAFGERARKNDRSGNLQYRQGPVWAGVAFDRLDNRNHLEIVAAGYDFGVVFPTLIHARAKGGLNGTAKSTAAGLRIRTGYGRAYVSIGTLRPATNLDATKVSAGTEYDLSKRTLLYANLGSAKRDGLTRTTAFDFGIKHTF